MGPFDIIVVVVICAAFAAVVGTTIYRKIKHKGGGCDCGCEGCSMCDKCRSAQKKNK